MKPLSIILVLLFTALAQAGYPAGTKVKLADGSTKPIEDIKIGDKVYSPLEDDPIREVGIQGEFYTRPEPQTAYTVTKVSSEIYSGVLVTLSASFHPVLDDRTVSTTDYKPLLYTAHWYEPKVDVHPDTPDPDPTQFKYPPSLEYKQREDFGPLKEEIGYIMRIDRVMDGRIPYCAVLEAPTRGINIYDIKEEEVRGMAIYSIEVQRRQKSYSVNGFTAVY